MKRFLIIIASLTAAFTTNAQESRDWKRLESYIQLVGGIFAENPIRMNAQRPGLVLRTSYGLDVRLNDTWSVMTGVGGRVQVAEVRHWGWVGGDIDGMVMTDVFCTARYHFTSDGTRMIVGLGPAYSFNMYPDTYYIDADPMDPRNSLEKFNNYDLGLQPSITILKGRHFHWGFEGNIGLLNALRQYPEHNINGKIYLNYFAAFCGFHF